MAKNVYKTTKGKNLRGHKFTKTVVKDTSKMSGRQQLKAKKLEYKTRTQQTRMRMAGLAQAGANVSQAIAGITGANISNTAQREQTKRLVKQLSGSSAAHQATQGGITQAEGSRDEDEEETTKSNPWAIGKL